MLTGLEPGEGGVLETPDHAMEEALLAGEGAQALQDGRVFSCS